MKKLLTVFIILILVFSFTGCNKDNHEESNVRLYDIYQNMLNSSTFSDMTYVSSDDENAENSFEYVSDLEYNKVDEYFLSYATNGDGNADEIVVIKLKDDNDVSDAIESLQNHWNYRISLFQVYDPSQVPKLEDGRLFEYNNYAVLIISSNPDDVKKAFINSFN